MTPEIQLKIDEALKYRDAQRAWEILVMATKDDQIQLPRLDYLRLNYLRMNALDPDRVLNIIKESVLAAYQIQDFDLDARLADYFELLEYIDVQIDFLYKLKAVLQNHQELLGDQKINVNGKLVIPTIANWILDYQSLINSEMKDALGEMKYINTAPNLKILSLGQRKALQSILRIYDRIEGFVNLYEELPDKLPPEELREFQNWVVEKYEQEYGTDIESPATVIPEENLVSEISEPAPVVEAENSTPPQESSAPYKIAPQKDLDLSTQPKKGLVFDIPTNIDLKQESISREKRAEQKLKELKIRTKLEELKNRNKSQTKS